MSSQAVGRIVY